MQAIVILYEGRPVDVEHAEMLIGALASLFKEGYSQPTMRTFTEDEIAKSLMSQCKPTSKSNTEAGDNAVKVIMGILPATMLSNRISVTTILAKVMAHSLNHTDDVSKAFVNAMKLLAEDAPVSKTVASDLHYNKAIAEIIKNVYTNFQ